MFYLLHFGDYFVFFSIVLFLEFEFFKDFIKIEFTYYINCRINILESCTLLIYDFNILLNLAFLKFLIFVTYIILII